MVESRRGKKLSNDGSTGGKTVVAGIIFLLISGIGLDANAQEGNSQPISIDMAIDIALTNNPQITAANLGVTREEKLKKAVVDLGNTSVNYSQGEINTPGFNDSGFEFTQSFKFPTVYGTRSKVQESRIVLSQKVVAISKNDLIRQVRREYIQLAWAYSQLELYTILDSVYEKFVKAAELRYTTGETNRLAKIAAEGKHQEVMLLKEQTLTDVEIYEHRLQHIMNYDSAVQITQTDLSKLHLAFTSDTSNTNLNPLLDYYKQRIDLAERQYKLQKSEFVPEFSAGFFTQKIEGISGATGFSVGVGIPLAFWANSGRSQAAEVSVEIASAEYDSYSLRLKTTFENYMQEFIKYQAQLDYYESKGLELADELVNFAGRGYAEGEIEYVEYIRNIDQANDIRNKYLETLRLYKQTKIEINYLMGAL